MKICPRCGREFTCGLETDSDGDSSENTAPRCWCFDRPPVPSLPPVAGSACLCPDCLDTALVTESVNEPMSDSTAVPLRVCSFESRRAVEMEALIRKRGGEPTVAPSMREVPFDQNPEVFAFADRFLAGEVDWILLLTGVGTEALRNAWVTRHDETSLMEAFARCRVFVRGPKPTAVLKKWKVRIDHTAPEPNTWREVLAVIDDLPVPEGKRTPIDGDLFAVQEYGRPNPELYDGLRERGATVLPVPVYRWAMPIDTAPLERAIRATIDDRFDWLLFTSAKQVEHVLELAEKLRLGDEFRAAIERVRIASIGPTCSEVLTAEGFPIHFEASPPKMGHLVKGVFEAATDQNQNSDQQ